MWKIVLTIENISIFEVVTMVFLNYTSNHFPQKWFCGPMVHATSNLRPGMVFSLENNGISRLKFSKIPSRSRDMKNRWSILLKNQRLLPQNRSILVIFLGMTIPKVFISRLLDGIFERFKRLIPLFSSEKTIPGLRLEVPWTIGPQNHFCGKWLLV